MAPSRDIAALVRNLKAENGVEEVKAVLGFLIDALKEDPTVASYEIVQAGGIEAMLDVMRQMPQDVHIQVHMCYSSVHLQVKPRRNKEVTEVILKAIALFLHEDMADDDTLLVVDSAMDTLFGVSLI